MKWLSSCSFREHVILFTNLEQKANCLASAGTRCPHGKTPLETHLLLRNKERLFEKEDESSDSSAVIRLWVLIWGKLNFQVIPRCLRGEVNNIKIRAGHWSSRGLLPEKNTHTQERYILEQRWLSLTKSLRY